MLLWHGLELRLAGREVHLYTNDLNSVLRRHRLVSHPPNIHSSVDAMEHESMLPS